jgi:hypothetical protein
MLNLMSRASASLGVLALAVLTGLLVPGLAAATDRPDFTGVWLFNPERSDDLVAAVEASAGPAESSGDIKKNIARLWIRQWLLSVLENPDSAYLTVEQSDKDFKTGLGDEVAIYYFGRVAASRGPFGGTLRVSAEWQGEQLVLTKRADDGGKITAVYTLLPGGKSLSVAYHLEHKRLVKPLDARMVFDRTDEDPG